MAIPLTIFIVLMPFAPFLFRGVDLWHGAGQYFQTGLLILFAISLFEKTKEVKIRNLPLALLTGYLGLFTCFLWYLTLKEGNLNFVVFGPFFNFLCFVIFYKLSFQLDRETIEKILTVLSYSICVYLFYCLLQFFDLDPFFKAFVTSNNPASRTVGLLGNKSHNAIYLSICLPLFYLKQNRFSTLCACFVWVILGIAGSTSALLTALGVTVFFSVFYRLSTAYYLFIVLGGVAFGLLNFKFGYLNPWGRLEIWKKLVPIIKKNPVFGQGLGMMNILSRTKDFSGWRHAHNEYYQYILEFGLIGVLGIVYCIYEYFRKMLKDRLGVVLASMFLGFCISSLFYYPSHLFLISFLAMISYSFMFVLKNEGVDYGIIDTL